MSKVVENIRNNNGKYFAKDTAGNVREIHQGDTVYSGEIVIDETGRFSPDALEYVNSANADLSVNAPDDKSALSEDTQEKKAPVSHNAPVSTTSTDEASQVSSESVDINADLQNPDFVGVDDVDDTVSQIQVGENGHIFIGSVDLTELLQEFHFIGLDKLIQIRQAMHDAIQDEADSSVPPEEILPPETDPVDESDVHDDGSAEDIASDDAGAGADACNLNDSGSSQGQQLNMQTVTVRLVPTDIHGNIIDPATIAEGEMAYYKVIALDSNHCRINDGSVDIMFSDGSAVRTGSSADGTLDFSAHNQTVAINQVFSAKALDDYLTDDNETFNVQIVDGSYSNPCCYACVNTITDPIVTTITDDGGSIEPTHEYVQIKLVALDENGAPILDARGNYTYANDVNEGDAANYMALAFAPGESTFNPVTKLANQIGTINVTLSDGTATGAGTQSANDGSQDFNNTPQISVVLGTVISKDTFDDYIADNGETFTISITDGSYVSPTPTTGYENVSIDTDPVTTTINDDSGTTPNDPNELTDEAGDPDNEEATHEVVQIKLVALDDAGDPILDGSGNYTFANSVNEDAAANYKAVAFAPGESTYSPTTQLADQLRSVTVSSRDTNPQQAVGITGAQTADDGSEDYTTVTTQTIALDTAFSVDTLDDYMSDNGEEYEVVIDDASYVPPTPTTGYENVSIDTDPVTTTILDNTNPNTPHDDTDGPEVDSEPVVIKLIALDENGDPILDGSGNYVDANDAKEGTAANYMALAFEPGTTTFNASTETTDQLGSVDIAFADGTTAPIANGAPSQTTNDGTQDFNNTAQTSSNTR